MPSQKGNASKGTSSKSKNPPPVEDDSFIVFGDSKKKGKKNNAKEQQEAAESTGPPKPTAKQIIGGASWTGKLPVNLLSEHCQRQKWSKPDYSMRQLPGRDGHEKMYSSQVTLSKTDPKTQEVTKISTFKTPPALASASEEPSALEARHFAAAYALFRISSGKNLSMALPPKYRDLWRGEFQQLKKGDEKEGRGWLYEADPFAAQQKTEEIHKAMDKRKADQEKKKEALAKDPNLAFMQTPRSKAWENAPKIEMGVRIRAEIEQLVRQSAVWNPYGLKLSKHESERISKSLSSKGFRSAHVQEALQYCKDEEEVLEWLLIHVPEDDLPGFALPANYSAGISLASDDVAGEAKLKRLASAGYPKDFCAQALKASEGSEQRAAFWLQSSLHTAGEGDLNDDIDSNLEWRDEKETLEAIFAERYSENAERDCSVVLDVTKPLSAVVRFIIPEKGYPYELPAILIVSKNIPAYIRLSATKQALQFAQTNFVGTSMVYSVCEWLEGNIQNLLDSPMSLTELHLAEKITISKQAQRRVNGTNNLTTIRNKRDRSDNRSNQDILSAWRERQASAQQQKMTKARASLLAWTKQNDILGAVAKNRVTIVTGETGSGKSTQVVQFVLDQGIQALSGSKTNILCTQPRRVAALSLADRVSSERCSTVGDEVGYIIRGDSKVSNTTKITFMTTGVLLRRLQTSSSIQGALEGISHIFIDEVHERSLDTDFLLALLKDSLKAHPALKVVLMSATLDKDVFLNYFGGAGKVSHVHVEGRTFPVNDLYLEDVLQMTRFMAGPGDSQDMPIGKAVTALGSGINYDLIRTLVESIDHELGKESGSILIFLSGTLEIDRCLRAISSIPNVIAYPLHASLLPAEQRKVFPPPPPGKRKVIAATNVAETSITIEDIIAVVDTGRVKETNYDISNNIVRLEEVWASQAACKQRRGRAGRVREGTCYKLFTKNVEAKMALKPLPEIQRVPLEQLCLSVKATGADRDVSTFLAALMTPPEQGAILNALKILHLMGALEKHRLTALGTYLALIPADLRCAKLLVYGTLFDCLEPCLTLAAILTVKDPFVSPRDKREEADAAKASFPTQHGDLVLSLSAYDEYVVVAQDLNYRQMQSWCNERFLSLTTLRDITSTRSQLLDSLKDASLVSLDYRSPEPQATNNGQKTAQNYSPTLLRALISASLQPQIAEIKFPEKKYMQALGGAKELDAEARQIKYFIPPPQTNESGVEEEDKKWQRVFIHPSSPLFHATPASFTSSTGSAAAQYLSYFSKMASGSTSAPGGPKTYIHSLTPLNVYTQLLFGSSGARIDTTVPGGGLIVSENYKVRGWARLGVLVSRLRRLLDEELARAFESNGATLEKSEVVRIVKWLVELNGQDR